MKFTPRNQTIVGVILMVLAFVAVWLQASKHVNVAILAIFLGAASGQQIAQAYRRARH